MATAFRWFWLGHGTLWGIDTEKTILDRRLLGLMEILLVKTGEDLGCNGRTICRLDSSGVELPDR